jgi:hypothetical protein
MMKVNLHFLRLTFFHAFTNSRAAFGKDYQDRLHHGNR